MDQKKVVYTLGTINSHPSSITWNTQTAVASLANRTRDITYIKQSTTHLDFNHTQPGNQLKAYSQCLKLPKKSKFIHKPAKGK